MKAFDRFMRMARSSHEADQKSELDPSMGRAHWAILGAMAIAESSRIELTDFRTATPDLTAFSSSMNKMCDALENAAKENDIDISSESVRECVSFILDQAMAVLVDLNKSIPGWVRDCQIAIRIMTESYSRMLRLMGVDLIPAPSETTMVQSSKTTEDRSMNKCSAETFAINTRTTSVYSLFVEGSAS